MKPILKTLLILPALAVAGCAGGGTATSTHISVVHNLPTDLTGKKYLSLAVKGDAGVQETALFGSIIVARLAKAGMTPTDDIEKADYVLGWDYEPARTSLVSSAYTYTLTVQLVDELKVRKMKSGLYYAYDGKATTEGSSESYRKVPRCMAEALMQDFPGKKRHSASIGIPDSCR